LPSGLSIGKFQSADIAGRNTATDGDSCPDLPIAGVFDCDAYRRGHGDCISITQVRFRTRLSAQHEDHREGRQV